MLVLSPRARVDFSRNQDSEDYLIVQRCSESRIRLPVEAESQESLEKRDRPSITLFLKRSIPCGVSEKGQSVKAHHAHVSHHSLRIGTSRLLTVNRAHSVSGTSIYINHTKRNLTGFNPLSRTRAQYPCLTCSVVFRYGHL